MAKCAAWQSHSFCISGACAQAGSADLRGCCRGGGARYVETASRVTALTSPLTALWCSGFRKGAHIASYLHHIECRDTALLS